MNLDQKMDRLIEYSFYALFIIVPLILTPVNFELFEFNKMLTVYFFTIIIATAWIIKMIFRGKFILKKTPFDIPLGLFFLSQLISTFLSIDIHTSVWGYYSRFHGGLMSTISYLVLYYAFVSNLSRIKRVLKNLLTVIFSTAAIVSIYAILEHLGIDKDLWVQDVQNRVFSTLGQPNWLAAYLLTLIPLSTALTIKAKAKKSSIGYLILTITLFFALLYTKSKSGLIGFIVSFITFWGLILLNKGIKKLWLKKLFLSLAITLTIVLITGTPYSPSLKTIFKKPAPVITQLEKVQPPAITLGGSKSSDIRKVVWQGALGVFKQYPVFGSGVETFAYSYYNHRPPEHNLLSEWDFLYNKAHNEFLNFLSTTGAFGLGTYLLIIIWFSLWTLKNLKKNLYLTSGFIAGFLGLAVSNFFGFSVVPVALFFFLWPAISYSFNQKPDTVNQQKQYYQLDNSSYILITLVTLFSGYLLLQTINLWKADKVFALGKRQLKSNQVQQSYGQLKQAVEMLPNEPLFRTEFAESAASLAVLYDQENTASPSVQFIKIRDQLINEATTSSQIVISQNKVHLNYWKSRIKVFLLLSTIDQQYSLKALLAIDEAINLSPTDAKLYYNQSLLYSQMGQTGQAEQVLVQTIDLKPNYEAARFALGSLYQQTSRNQLAKEQYEYILENLNPNNEKVKEKLENL